MSDQDRTQQIVDLFAAVATGINTAYAEYGRKVSEALNAVKVSEHDVDAKEAG